MDVLKISSLAIDQAIQCIRAGGVIAHATETCYGFACDLTNADAVKKLFQIKQRPFDQPVSALFASVKEAKKWVEWGEVAEKLAREHLPGPLTIVLPRTMEQWNNGTMEQCNNEEMKQLYVVPDFEIAKTQSIGIRISSHPVAMELARRCGFPLSTTSANLHGKPNPYSVEEIVAQFKDQNVQPDLVLDSGMLPGSASSSVVVVEKGGFSVVRKGELF